MMKTIFNLLENRYTSRHFDSKKPVLDKHKDLIIKAALTCPSQDERFAWKMYDLSRSKKGLKVKQEIWYNLSGCYHQDEHGKKLRVRFSAIKTAPFNLLFTVDPKL